LPTYRDAETGNQVAEQRHHLRFWSVSASATTPDVHGAFEALWYSLIETFVSWTETAAQILTTLRHRNHESLITASPVMKSSLLISICSRYAGCRG
jgi:hypothetical protein